MTPQDLAQRMLDELYAQSDKYPGLEVDCMTPELRWVAIEGEVDLVRVAEVALEAMR